MGWFSDFVSDPIGTIGETGQGAIDAVSEAGSDIDDFVNETIPGGWATVALITAGYYYSPELGAYVSSDGATTVAASDVAAADAAGATTAGTAGAGAGAGAGTAATGLTVNNVINGIRGGLLVNALTGDPLGLSDTGGGGTSGPTGFAQVPIPAEWKSPTYTYSPVQNVTFEDLFPEMSLKGTQWRGMQLAEPNMTFNEMFASGLQKTPMGSPVDINQIVGAIVGQGTKS